ncbi:hypothetical protein SI65_00349 [Aspergillus cristatus]|uniref:Uncharacterized protein n=1 Tax=Aspergillus cristatus TaxID=573508 RepID=A0A1E3BP71_ASPCR|nr:hypothetical protein SI65_00349 [Aspergillus cristatus]
MERRIEDLEHMLNSPVIGEHTANATAVLYGYQSRKLKYVAGHYYVFRDGQMLTGPRPLLSFDEETVVFDEFNGPQGLWTKRCDEPPVLMAVSGSIRTPLYQFPFDDFDEEA